MENQNYWDLNNCNPTSSYYNNSVGIFIVNNFYFCYTIWYSVDYEGLELGYISSKTNEHE
jgi:hypothetical protein